MTPTRLHVLHRTGILVIGAGVVGASIARELAVRGETVTIIDEASGIGGGCSYANASLLAPSHVGPLATMSLLREAPLQMVRRPPAVRISPSLDLLPWLGKLTSSAFPRKVDIEHYLKQLATESAQLHCDLAAEGLNPTLKKTGAVDVYMRRHRRTAAGSLPAGSLRAIEPGLGPAAIGGVHHTEEWVVESRSYVKAMLDDAAKHGATVMHSTKAVRLNKQDNTIVSVETDAGTIEVDRVVLAAGVTAGQLSHQVGLRLPLRGGRGYVIDVAAPRDLLSMPVRLKENRVVVTPLDDRIRVCGSIEFGDEGRRVDLRRADALLELAVQAVPGLAGRPVIDRWAGERPCSADGVPAIGTSTVVANLSVAVGHGMWGLILAPVTARIIANQISAEQVENETANLHLLDPDRFTKNGETIRVAV
ncbi:NAD(P)/FAD-dependent oxidoreductase [Rhodococcus sp. IEGM1428]|uniref:NAD(P)/FAD-dependent oxidoreductase n=1 Tax=Rhodococcus sp. IEGM1428 TaxID=3392191 RepID=UPI003D0C3E5F